MNSQSQSYSYRTPPSSPSSRFNFRTPESLPPSEGGDPRQIAFDSPVSTAATRQPGVLPLGETAPPSPDIAPRRLFPMAPPPAPRAERYLILDRENVPPRNRGNQQVQEPDVQAFARLRIRPKSPKKAIPWIDWKFKNRPAEEMVDRFWAQQDELERSNPESLRCCGAPVAAEPEWPKK